MTYIQTGKLVALLHSRKFWALVTALVVDLFGYLNHAQTAEVAILGALATVSAYMISTAVEDAGASQITAAKINAQAATTAKLGNLVVNIPGQSPEVTRLPSVAALPPITTRV